MTQLPITEWNFKGYDLRHIGPMAQDFHAAFRLGGSETSIDSGDLDGVALAAIQGLRALVKERETEIEDLKKRLSVLEEYVKVHPALGSEEER